MDLALVSEYAARRASGWNRRRGAPSEHASKAQERERWEAREPARRSSSRETGLDVVSMSPFVRAELRAGAAGAALDLGRHDHRGVDHRGRHDHRQLEPTVRPAKWAGGSGSGQAKGIGAVAPLTRGSEGLWGRSRCAGLACFRAGQCSTGAGLGLGIGLGGGDGGGAVLGRVRRRQSRDSQRVNLNGSVRPRIGHAGQENPAAASDIPAIPQTLAPAPVLLRATEPTRRDVCSPAAIGG
jgi:hypothetical protein